jgi:hypothetical protein
MVIKATQLFPTPPFVANFNRINKLQPYQQTNFSRINKLQLYQQIEPHQQT